MGVSAVEAGHGPLHPAVEEEIEAVEIMVFVGCDN